MTGSALDLTCGSRAGSGLDLANRLQLLNKDSHSLGEEPSPLDPGRRSPVGGARYTANNNDNNNNINNTTDKC